MGYVVTDVTLDMGCGPRVTYFDLVRNAEVAQDVSCDDFGLCALRRVECSSWKNSIAVVFFVVSGDESHEALCARSECEPQNDKRGYRAHDVV